MSDLTEAPIPGQIPAHAAAHRRRVMLVAAEPSGDVLGARLMAALRLRTLGEVDFIGVGGPHMAKQGLTSLFPMDELTAMGLIEVLPKIPHFASRLRKLTRFALRERPDVLVTIDAPDFNFRLGRRLKGQGIPIVHYVAPSVWAWRPGRARQIARFLDHLMALLPFEPPYFEAVGLPCTFVGHPVVESGFGRGSGASFRERHDLKPEQPLVAVLPGSRAGEIRYHLRIFAEALTRLALRWPQLAVVVPTVAAVAAEVGETARGFPFPTIVVTSEAEKYDAMAAANVALAASGTVALELALAGVPAVIAYRVNPLTAALARRLLKVRYVSLVNLVLDQPVMPELLQEACEPKTLAREVEKIMVDPARRTAQNERARTAMVMLGQVGEPPSLRAADVVLRTIAQGPRHPR